MDMYGHIKMMNNMNTTQDTAKALLNLFGPKGEHWTQHTPARNHYGDPVPADFETARSWCLIGGMGKVYDAKKNILNWFKAFREFSERAHREQFLEGISLRNFNDTKEWPEVKEFLEKMSV